MTKQTDFEHLNTARCTREWEVKAEIARAAGLPLRRCGECFDKFEQKLDEVLQYLDEVGLEIEWLKELIRCEVEEESIGDTHI
jgi:hypothetical protein